MFFTIKKVKGKDYLYKADAFRHPKSGKPTNIAHYVGSVKKIEETIKRWKQNE